MSDPHDSEVSFQLLGPLQARRGAATPDLGSLRRRTVLAVLLLHGNRPIGREQLITAVWGDDIPAYAVNIVQKHISALRRTLEPARPGGAPSHLITWTDAGYLMTVPDERVDLRVAEARVREAREARSAGDLPVAAKALRAALEVWTGALCEGLSAPYLDAERDRLAERRLSLTEERIEADLAAGDPPDVVPELRQILAEHPLRERSWALLMEALHRQGRRGAALEAYRDARRCLRDELGVEPSAPLQELHGRILAAGETPAASPTPVRRARTAPDRLPYGLTGFTGRHADLDRLRMLLAEHDAGRAGAGLIVVVSGTAGVGKSALALHWANEIRDRFPGGRLCVDLRGFSGAGAAQPPGDVLNGFLDAFGVPPAAVPAALPAKTALFRSLLTGRRALVVLDNARDAEQVRPLLPGAPGCLVLVTSRSELPGLVAHEGARLVPLELPSATEARDMLVARLGHDRVAREPRAVDDIIAFCARLPLALAIVAARAAARPGFGLGAIAAELGDAGERLDALDGGDRSTDLRALFSWSYEALSPAARRLFRLLALHPGPDLGRAAAASLAGIAPEALRPVLAELTRMQLVTEVRPGRYAFHDLLRAYAAELGRTHDGPDERTAAVRGVLQHYLHSAHTAGRALDPYREDDSPPVAAPGVTTASVPDREHALAWFDAERPVLPAILRLAAGAGPGELARQLSWALPPYFEYRGYWTDWAEAQEAALLAAEQQNDLPGQAVAHRILGRACTRLIRYPDALGHLTGARRLYERLGDPTGSAHTHLDLAFLFDQRQQYRQALEHTEQALALFREAGHVSGQARALNAIGWFHSRLGAHAAALTHCGQALELQERTGDRFWQAETWDSLGFAHRHLGDTARAVHCYHRALDLYREFGDRYNEADTLVYLGDALGDAGRAGEAHAAWQRALVILDDLHHVDAEAVRARLAVPAA